MKVQFRYNDAWESVEFTEEACAFIKLKLQRNHPLKCVDFYPVAKRWRSSKFFLEAEDGSSTLWILDLDRKARIGGKVLYYFKEIETQSEFDEILRNDLVWWTKYMKDAGAWNK
jgi:hypothetical protein